ncbi:MAG: molecular chaperone Tir [Okeania sp. SIO1H6]|nr:AAA-like domain-containing protein [Trichodesmium sp. MO_231.B1]NET16770.1 molecular chaperone Tir [Okeania sp. SIO1H6]
MPKLFVITEQESSSNIFFANLTEKFNSKNYEYFIANYSQPENKRIKENYQKLKESDYLILLLTAKSILNEMVTETVRIAKKNQDYHPEQKPWIIPIKTNIPIDSPWDYNLYSYLFKIRQWEWENADEPEKLIVKIINYIEKPVFPSTPEMIIESKFINDSARNFTYRKPLPSSPPKLPKSQDNYAASFYIERPPIEKNCYQEITKPGALIRIKAPRQMGKTSLMARILDRAAKLGYQTAVLNLQLVESQIFNNLDKFLRWFCAAVASELNLAANLDNYWNEIFGSKVSCKSYFERYILKSIDTPIVLALDEVDYIFQYPEITVDFFSLLRAWHEDAKNRDLWKNMRLIVVHSTEAYVPIDINQSPFNVGLPIDLPELSADQIQDLASHYQLQLDMSEIEKLMAIVGGNPYLIKLALYQLFQKKITIDELLKTAATDIGCYAAHLQRHWCYLQQYPELAQAFKTVISCHQTVKLEVMQGLKLNSIGLINLQGNEATPSCELYNLYFKERLENSNF